MNIIEKTDEEIRLIADPLWSDLVKFSNAGNYDEFVKHFANSLALALHEVEFGRQFASSDLAKNLADEIDYLGVIRRGEQIITVTAVPEEVEVTEFGSTQKIGRLGVSRPTSDMVFIRHDPFTAVWKATIRSYVLTTSILDALGQIITGTRTAKELGGPVRIAQISGDMAQAGLVMIIQFAAVLSINLGLINLFPIPLLDGGHLVFYGVEAIRGRPVGEKAMGYSLNIGLALILCLTIFVTWNDLVQMRVFEYLMDLVT